MTNKEFYNLMDKVFNESKAIAKAKGEDYTKGSADALANFKEVGASMGISPEKACWIFMNKHYTAITNYIRTGGKSESEPIEERIKDLINYLVLLQGVIHEKENPAPLFDVKEPIEEDSKIVLAKNQVWLWYEDIDLVDVFIIEDIKDGCEYIKLYGQERLVRRSFFEDLELMESLKSVAEPEEKAFIQKELDKYLK